VRSTPPHILVVDHDEATRQLLGRMLQASGFTVESAARGREALERLGETLPDLVLLDVDLPDLPGDQVLEQIRARPEWASLAVVHVSAAPAGDDSGALDSGADAHLTLPIEALELSATLRAVLRARAAEQAGHHFARQWQKTFDAISDGVCLLDRAGLVQRCNRAFCELVAHPFHDVIGQRFAAVIEPALGCAALPVRDLSELRAGAVAECQSPVADGRWFRVAADPVLDDRRQLVGAVLIITEITQHKLVEQRIQQSNAELMQANRIKDEFLATLSHELRTPLNAIVGWTRLLRAGKLDADNAARALETIDRNATLQAKLIEDLLDVSRIITGKLRLRPASVDLVSIVEAGMSSVRPAADAKRIRLELRDDDGGVIFADGDRLQQVMWNLLSNAIKFTPEGGHVRIDIRRAGDAVEIRVSDDGRGISQAFLPFVFERFRQADSSTTRAHGGLGLAIVRHLVELHGGTVHADSDGDGRGATFTITLPARARARRNSVPAIPVDAVAQPLGDGVRLGGLSLLVVEDDPDSRELLAAALSQRGARVEACGSVEEALGKLDGGIDVDIIISDIGMPGEDGYALMARVRSLPPPVGDTPAIALTAYATADDVRRALAAGYQCHVCKPVDAPTLARVIRELAAIPAPVMTGDTQPILLAGKLDG
jgi:PAS domain S-box-containing protein